MKEYADMVFYLPYIITGVIVIGLAGIAWMIFRRKKKGKIEERPDINEEGHE